MIRKTYFSKMIKFYELHASNFGFWFFISLNKAETFDLCHQNRIFCPPPGGVCLLLPFLCSCF